MWTLEPPPIFGIQSNLDSFLATPFSSTTAQYVRPTVQAFGSITLYITG